MAEIVRKICLVFNWGFFGGLGIVIGVISIIESDMFTLGLLALGAFFVGAILHKIINWVFE